MFRHMLRLTVLAALVAVCLHAPLGAAWIQDGDGLNVNLNLNAINPSLAVSNGTPYVAWQEEVLGPGNFIYVKRWNGRDWEPVGGNLKIDTDKFADDPSLAISNGTPYAVWSEYNESYMQIYMKHWNGSNWERDGGSLNVNANQPAQYPKLAFSGHTPYVAWSEGSVSQIFVKHWDGGNWLQNGGSLNLNANQNANSPSLAAFNGTPYVAWHENDGTHDQIYVKHWTGAGWTQDGGSLNYDVNQSGQYPSLFVFNGTPYAAWQETIFPVPGAKIYVKYWNGSGWEQIGGYLNGNYVFGATHASLAVDGNMPCVAWSQNEYGGMIEVYVTRWNGNAWELEGGSLNIKSSQKAYCPSLAFSGPTPYVAWQEGEGSEIYVKHWEFTPTISPTSTITPSLTPTPSHSPTVTSTPTATPISTSTCTPMPVLSEGGWVEPNPFVPTLGKTAKFIFKWENNQGSYRIAIYNLRGQLQRTLSNTREWDGRSDAGHLCEGGVYVYQIEAEGKRVSGKVVLLK